MSRKFQGIIEKASSPTGRFLIWLFAVSLAVRLVFVFAGTDYTAHLYSDMDGYWQRALARLGGMDTEVSQWALWPPLFHILLSFLFRIVDLVGLGAFRLEVVLFGNILLASVSVCLLYLITARIFPSPGVAPAVALSYAFSYPLVYLNAFVLSENLAVPLLITSLWFLLRGTLPGGVFGGITLGLAVGIRPALGVLVLIFAIFAVTGKDSWKERGGRGAAFLAAFVLILGLVSLENARISAGRLRGFAANGGLVFYLNQSKLHSLTSRFDGYQYTIIPPSASLEPERGSMDTTIPVYDQAAFYRMGFEQLKEDPGLLWRNFTDLRSFFTGPLLPTMPATVWFAPGMALFQKLYMIMACSLLLWGVVAREKLLSSPHIILTLAIPLAMAVTHYFYGAEQRYLYSFVFALHLAFFGLLGELAGQWGRQERPVLAWLAVSLVVVFW